MTNFFKDLFSSRKKATYEKERQQYWRELERKEKQDAEKARQKRVEEILKEL